MKLSLRGKLTEDEQFAAPIATSRAVLTSRPVLAVLGVVLLAALAESMPGLRAFRLFSAQPTAREESKSVVAAPLQIGEAELETESRNSTPLPPESGRATPSPFAKRRRGVPEEVPAASAQGQGQNFADKEAPVAILDPSGNALDAFFRALERTRRKLPGATTRITHFGDSIVVSDFVSGTLRRRFQENFGDAGHGFTLIANAWPAYSHNDVERYATAGWKVSRVVGPLAEDGLYGLGCVSFRAEKNVLARFGTVKKGDLGRNVSRFSVSYLEQPGGGNFRIAVDGTTRVVVRTAGPSKRSAFHEVSVADGPHEFELFTESGVSRLFGVVLERAVPGVVLDAIGIQGARIRFLDKQDDAHWAEQLQARSPQLLIYEFGANESADGFLYPMADYQRTMRDVLLQGKRALPDASCLVIGAMDRATKRGEELVSLRVIPSIIERQRAAAAETGCAFFDTYAAMGGYGSMPNWVRRGLGQADFTHPSGAGSDLIGTWIYRALMRSYGEFVARNVESDGAGKPNSASPTNSPSLR